MTQPTHESYVETKRKQRVVKNAYVDIDGVTAQPGHNYREWIKITKQLLKERDRVLINIKIQKLQSIVTNELVLNGFQPKQFTVKQETIENTLTVLSNKINEWNGINIRRRQSAFARYRDYWGVGKKWWDRTKTRLFGALFWLTSFAHIQKIVSDDSLLLLKIIAALFDGTVKYNNTRLQPLINHNTIIHSKEIHDYLFKINSSVTINKWIHDNGGGQKPKVITNKIQHQLAQIISGASNQDHNHNHNQSVDVTTMAVMPQFDVHNHVTSGRSSIFNIGYNGYQSYHQAPTYVARDARYTPLQYQMVPLFPPNPPQVTYLPPLSITNQFIFL